ncbi:emrE [Escherichia coli O25b:H4]|uniref:EmrE SMR transporter n=2 Tax=Escherichia coli TaxID=562 RepID=A0AA36KYA0_ECOLX|nr:emrE [Escherichia coli O25b:H4]CDN82496.1 EmrE SMR transporter [Escherichia coli O25b:H4-ST131]
MLPGRVNSFVSLGFLLIIIVPAFISCHARAPWIHIHQDENSELCSNCSTILSSMNRKEYAMNPYIYLGGAILAEVIGTTLMKFSEGFTRLWPSVGTIICYCASFWLLAQTLAYIPTGIAYAIWSGVGIVLISLLSWGFFGQRLDLPAIIGMMLICAGVLVINLLSRSAPH